MVPNFSMSYIRVKKIGEREYAYLVRTRWLKARKQAKQSVSKYLGRVFSFEKRKELEFLDFVKSNSIEEYLKDKGRKEVIMDFARWEFEKHEIKYVKINDELGLMLGKRDITLKLNDGFMNGYTLNELHCFKKQKKEDDGIEMAKRFVNAGIAIPKEVFVEVFSSNIFK